MNKLNGFSIYKDFITEDEEQALLQFVSGLVFYDISYGSNGGLASRLYGYKQGKVGNTPSNEPIPFKLKDISARVHKKAGEELPEVMISQYPIGSHLDWHRDFINKPNVAVLSLLGSSPLLFRPVGKTAPVITKQIPPRSLYFIQDDAWQKWEHRIPRVENERYTIIWRTSNSQSSEENKGYS